MPMAKRRKPRRIYVVECKICETADLALGLTEAHRMAEAHNNDEALLAVDHDNPSRVVTFEEVHRGDR